ncbi:MAG: hypothetical protein M0R02_09090 [Bacteroidales bacterium]|jgi:hypothetical protein|nr:hypothetical protein [Bacteroidales bacterium]NLK81102.1 hypothetical protein [Bacteroidales bacterium]
MKILAIEQICDASLNVQPTTYACACYPDSSLLRNNDDFYIPNFCDTIIAFAGVYVKISKIGKCIEPMFVHRYISEIGLAINIFAQNVLQTLHAEGKSTDIARGFDKSFAVSSARLPYHEHCESLSLKIEYSHQNFLLPLTYLSSIFDECVSVLSSYYTLKIGDYVFVPLHYIKKLAIDDKIHLSFNQQKVALHCKIQ